MRIFKLSSAFVIILPQYLSLYNNASLYFRSPHGRVLGKNNFHNHFFAYLFSNFKKGDRRGHPFLFIFSSRVEVSAASISSVGSITAP